jgi:hypothetical protein
MDERRRAQLFAAVPRPKELEEMLSGSPYWGGLNGTDELAALAARGLRPRLVAVLERVPGGLPEEPEELREHLRSVVREEIECSLLSAAAWRLADEEDAGGKEEGE